MHNCTCGSHFKSLRDLEIHIKEAHTPGSDMLQDDLSKKVGILGF